MTKLYHATHRKSAEQIHTKEPPLLTFHPAPKKGKNGYNMVDGSPLGVSYKCQLDGEIPNKHTRYQYVSAAEHLFPEGYYSWWGLKPNEDSSRYGGHMFTVDFPYMLDRFRHAHTTPDKPQPGIFFMKAGTLRYKREICYVILVCADTDDLTEVQHLPPVTEDGGHIVLNGLLDGNGKLVNPSSYLSFKQSLYSGSAWDQLVFGFYFSPRCHHKRLKLEMEKVEYNPKFPHNFCIRTCKVKEEYCPRNCNNGWSCPDNPDLPPGVDMEELIDYGHGRKY